MRRRVSAESLQHDHRHLGQNLAKILEGRDSIRCHLATSRHASELAAQTVVQLLAKIMLGCAHLRVPGIPGHKNADPGLSDVVQAFQPFVMRFGQAHPRINQTQARWYRLSVAGPGHWVILNRPDQGLAVEAFLG